MARLPRFVIPDQPQHVIIRDWFTMMPQAS